VTSPQRIGVCTSCSCTRRLMRSPLRPV
jgi:hypothetical protein